MSTITIILFILFFVGVVSVTTKSEPDWGHLVLLLCIALLASMVMIEAPRLSDEKFDEGYKQGQIDAINGDYKYELEIKQDSIYKEIR